MTSTKSKRGGRPRVADESVSVSIRVDASELVKAEEIAEHSGAPGLRPTRAAVLRAALSRGLDAMRAEVDAKLKPSRR